MQMDFSAGELEVQEEPHDEAHFAVTKNFLITYCQKISIGVRVDAQDPLHAGMQVSIQSGVEQPDAQYD